MNHMRIEVTERPRDGGYDTETPAHDASARLAIEQLFRAIAAPPRRTAHAGRESSGLAPWQMLRVRDHIESGLSGAIDVACLARIAKLSASHFARAFRASFGATPAAYVAVRRVERAKTLMLQTTEPLCRISLDCGFTDQSHLSRVFRRAVGQSPSQWRRRHRQD